MKCDKCRFNRMCKLRNTFIELLIPFIARINMNTVIYKFNCKLVQSIFDNCEQYEEYKNEMWYMYIFKNVSITKSVFRSDKYNSTINRN